LPEFRGSDLRLVAFHCQAREGRGR
jgi:hypothetical protein